MEPTNLSDKLPEESSDKLPEESSDKPQDDPSSAFSPRSIPPRPASHGSLQKYLPLEWLDYFDREDDVIIPGSNDVFHIYIAGSEGPVVFCLHGGGYSGRKVDEKVEDGAIPAYFLDRDVTTRAKVLSNTIKQKRKEKAGKWDVPLPKGLHEHPYESKIPLQVRLVAEDEMFRVIRTGKRKRKYAEVTNNPENDGCINAVQLV